MYPHRMTIARLAGRVLCAVILLLVCAGSASAQWPTVIMFHGGTLKQPVFATGADTPAFSAFVSGPAAVPAITAKDMGDRAFVNVAFFWGPRDNPANNGTPLADLKPEMTWQHGRFYPAIADKPAMMFMTGSVLQKQMSMPFMLQGGSRMSAVPSDPASFHARRDVPAATLDVLKRLGVPTDVRR